ncbi:unnamed protein product [Victoria cruziana]
MLLAAALIQTQHDRQSGKIKLESGFPVHVPTEKTKPSRRDKRLRPPYPVWWSAYDGGTVNHRGSSGLSKIGILIQRLLVFVCLACKTAIFRWHLITDSGIRCNALFCSA